MSFTPPLFPAVLWIHIRTHFPSSKQGKLPDTWCFLNKLCKLGEDSSWQCALSLAQRWAWASLNVGGADGVRGVGRHESGKVCFIYPFGINTALAASSIQLLCVKPTWRNGTNTPCKYISPKCLHLQIHTRVYLPWHVHTSPLAVFLSLAHKQTKTQAESPPHASVSISTC